MRDTAELRHGDERDTVKLFSRSAEGRCTCQRAVRGELTPEEVAEIPEIFHPLLEHLRSPISSLTGETVVSLGRYRRRAAASNEGRAATPHCAPDGGHVTLVADAVAEERNGAASACWEPEGRRGSRHYRRHATTPTRLLTRALR